MSTTSPPPGPSVEDAQAEIRQAVVKLATLARTATTATVSLEASRAVQALADGHRLLGVTSAPAA